MNTEQTPEKNIIVIHHDNCADGMAAAWCMSKLFGANAQYVPGNYGKPLTEDVTGKEIYLVDFCYPREVMQEMVRKADKVVLIDHHKTAIKAMLEPEPIDGLEMHVSMDNTKSGAGLAWEYIKQNGFNPAFRGIFDLPKILAAIQDRDLWRWELKDTAELTAYAFSQEFSILAYDRMMHVSDVGLELMREIGKVMLEKQNKDIKSLAKNAKLAIFDGYVVSMVNANGMFASDLGDYLNDPETQPSPLAEFAVIWVDLGADGYKYSLRSRGDMDVAVIAEKFGGGGHKNAAGFVIKKDYLEFHSKIATVEVADE